MELLGSLALNQFLKLTDNLKMLSRICRLARSHHLFIKYLQLRITAFSALSSLSLITNNPLPP